MRKIIRQNGEQYLAYTYHELTQEAKDRAIEEHREYSKQLSKKLGYTSDPVVFTKSYIEQWLITNEYLFTETGTELPICYYWNSDQLTKVTWVLDRDTREEEEVELIFL